MVSVRYPEEPAWQIRRLKTDTTNKMGKLSCEAFAALPAHSSVMLRVQWSAAVWDARTRLAESISEFHKLSIRTFVHGAGHAHP